MKINCEKLASEKRNDFVAALNSYLKKGSAKLDGEIVRISDGAEIPMSDYFKVCSLLKNYGVELDTTD